MISQLQDGDTNSPEYGPIITPQRLHLTISYLR